MATADKLSYLSQTKTAIKEAIVEKGVDVSSSDTFRSYADKIKSIQAGGGSGGSKLYVTNETGKEFVEGDKVLVNFSGTEGTEYLGSTSGEGTGPRNNFIGPRDNYIIRTAGGGTSEYEWTPSGFTLTTHKHTGIDMAMKPYIYEKGVLTFAPHITSGVGVMDLNNMTVSVSKYWSLGENLKLNVQTGVLYNLDESLSYDVGIGNMFYKDMTVQIFDNIGVICTPSAVIFLDVTNFPSCTKVEKNLPLGLTKIVPWGMTGVLPGSYFIFNNETTLYFYKYTGEGFEYVDSLVTVNGKGCVNVNIDDGFVCAIRSDCTPTVYFLSDGTVKRKTIPIEIFKKIKKDMTNAYINNGSFNTNKDLTSFSWAWSTGNSSVGRFNCAHVGGDFKIYIAEPEQINYTEDYSFTGYVTGKKDVHGRVEVSLLLSEEIPLTFETNVPTGDDEIIFEGMK